MHKTRLVFVNTQESRCGNCKRIKKGAPIDYFTINAATFQGNAISGCRCEHEGWSSDYFHINASTSPWLHPDDAAAFVPRRDIVWQ